MGSQMDATDEGLVAPHTVRRTPTFRQDLAERIDHTLLHPEARQSDVQSLCREALEYGFATVCVSSAHVPFCAQQLEGSTVGLTAVVGFPLGTASVQAKAFEAAEAIEQGATEVDMVLGRGPLCDRDFAYVYRDVEAVVQASRGHTVKVILETGALQGDQLVIACALSKAAGAEFVKTSTGFGGSVGATLDAVAAMRRAVGDEMGIKASGGIRDAAQADAMVHAGATRLGTSASVAIVLGTCEL
ncbi:MAG: deoxyribose-phosphate aldolase [Myxococcota bacterium]